MAMVTILGNDYPSFITVDEADEYLAADLARSDAWLAQDPDLRAKAVVSATRLLLRLQWLNGPPDVNAPPQPVKDATALLAADIAAKPALGDGASTGSNVKAVGAGSGRVEFFRPTEGYVLPIAAFALLRGLLGGAQNDGGAALDNAAYGSHDCQRSRFDRTDYGLVGDGTYNPEDRLTW